MVKYFMLISINYVERKPYIRLLEYMKILLTHMWMVIGGAETHVVELAASLVARGHDVTVASNGGVFVDELERAGVRHFNVPLHTKRPLSMIKSYRLLKKLILKEKFDIVHAHSRIPAFICGMLSKRLGFRFVTSTHAVFKVNGLLANVSDWGDHTFAVSCDIKQYLIDNYKTPQDNITLTINGIDTERFKSDIDNKKARSELNLSKDKYRVVYVSRIDNETALPGFLLCDAAPSLIDIIPNLEIIIVGGGTAFDTLSKKADNINSKLSKQVIRLTGPRTDVAEILSTADIFVGVSRAALEAMSEENPVILAGQQGYIGVLKEDVLGTAKRTNFTCRGEALPTVQNLIDDIKEIYSMPKERVAELGALCRRVVIEGYSIDRMAEDHIEVYKKLTPFKRYNRGDIIISGYYGFGNVGDDSLLSSIIVGLKSQNPEARITVLAKKPKRLARISGVRTINRFNIPSVIREMLGARLLISGGGSLLQDGTSKKSLFYYTFIMKMAKKLGLKLVLYANGLGPICSRDGRKLSAEVMADADYISLRENSSLELARELGVTKDIYVSADPAFLLEDTASLWLEHIISREGIPENYFIVSVKDTNNFDGFGMGKNTLNLIADEIVKISEKYKITPLFIPMYPAKDTVITTKLYEACKCGLVITSLSASELCAVMKGARLVIGTRLHTLIFAAKVCVPMLAISYDPKINAFIDYLNREFNSQDLLQEAIDVRKIKEGELVSAAQMTLIQDKKIRTNLEKCLPVFEKRARNDYDACTKIYRSLK